MTIYSNVRIFQVSCSRFAIQNLSFIAHASDGAAMARTARYSIYLFHLTTLALAAWIVSATSLYAAYINRMIALFAVIGLAWALFFLLRRALISLGHRARYQPRSGCWDKSENR